MKPISENIGDTSRRIQGWHCLNEWPYKSDKAALEENVCNGLVLVIENTPRTPIPVAFNKIVFGKDHSSTKIPTKIYGFSGIFIFQIFLLVLTGISEWMIALYKESTEKVPLTLRF
jgi:hypothetical protein